MAKSTVTPLELAKRYLIKIGVDKLIVEKSLLPSLFNEAILCKQLSKSDVVLANKKGSGSNETHIFINKHFWYNLFSTNQITTYATNPVSTNNQQATQTIYIFEANLYDSLNRRTKKISPSVVAKAPSKTYNANSNVIISTHTTKWFNQHNSSTQLHLGQLDSDGNEFNDFRLGLLVDDYLIMLKYANQDSILALSIPAEFFKKYNVIGQSKINRKLSATDMKTVKQYLTSDSEYSSESNSRSIASEQTPMTPAPPQKGSKRNASSKVKYKGKPSRGKGALEKAHYTCENDPTHTTFTSDVTGKDYMEPHHLIPISNQGLYEHDIDITSNLICLCPTCHKQIHYGQKTDIKQMLSAFYATRKSDLKTCGIEIDLDTLLAYYDVY